MRVAFVVTAGARIGVTLLGVLGGVLVVVAVAGRVPETPEARQPSAGDRRQVAGAAPDLRLGRSVFRDHCARCHGADARGKIGPSLVSVRLSRSQIQATVRSGTPRLMPAFGGVLSAEELRAVSSYVKSLGGPVAVASQARSTTAPATGRRTRPRRTAPQPYSRWPMCP